MFFNSTIVKRLKILANSLIVYVKLKYGSVNGLWFMIINSRKKLNNRRR